MNAIVNAKIQTLGRILLLLVGLLGLVVVASTLKTRSHISQIGTVWQQFEEGRSDKRRVLNELYVDLGYGGMIHEFKNYVLRQDAGAVASISAKLGSAQESVTRYRALGTDATEDLALAELADVLEHYRKALEKSNSLVMRGINPREIDTAVRVDDAPAFRALNTLDKLASTQGRTHTPPLNKWSLINELRRALGYGGVIHHFKNYVLRHEAANLDAVHENVSRAEKSIARYTDLNLSKSEEAALLSIRSIFEQYVTNLGMARDLVAQSKSPTEIDRFVKVDDRPALKGLATLIREVNSQNAIQAAAVINDLDLVTTLTELMLGFTLLATALIIGISFWLLRYQIVRPIELLADVVLNLAKGNLETALPVSQQRNEIGGMIRSIEVFRDNAVERARVEEELWEARDVLERRVEERTLELKETEAEARLARNLLRDAIENISEAFVVYDANDRMVLCNGKFIDLYPWTEEICKPGVTFAELAMSGARANKYSEAKGREEDWLADRIAQHRDLENTIQRQLADGRWFMVSNRATSTGGIVGIRADISQIKETELKASRIKKQILEVLESLSEAFALYDADDRLVLFNNRYLEFHADSADLIVPGARFEDILRTGAERGQYVEAVGRVDEWVAGRMLDHNNLMGPRVQQLGDGRWLRITEFRTPSGSIAGLRSDITSEKHAEEALLQSERRYRDLIDGSIQGVIVQTNGKILFANQSAADLFGYDNPKELIDLPSSILLAAPKERERIINYRDARTRGESAPTQYLYKGIRKDGSEVWIQNLARVIEWDGETSIQTTLTDITAEVQAEEELRKLSLAVEQSANGIFITDLEGVIEYSNPALSDISGYSEEEILERTPGFLKSGETPLETYQDLWKSIKSGRTWRGAIQNRRKDGDLYWSEQVVSPIRGLDGEITHFVAIQQDVTDRVEMEHELVSAKERAELSDRSKTEFIANMSHELRTPLNAIIGFSEIIEQELYGPIGVPRYNKYLTDIRESGEHLLGIINDILDLSRIEAGQMHLNESEIDVSALVGSCISRMRHRAAAAGVELEYLVEALPALYADSRVIRQILINLFDNAVKFTPEGGTCRVTGSLGAGGEMELTVADTGIGMSDDEIPIALERFGQIESDLDRRYEGTGLGLPLATSLIELHGGALGIKSEKGAGTSVTLRFPPERIIS